jgi:hypothetical protein
MGLLTLQKVLRSPFSNKSPQSRALQHQRNWLQRRFRTRRRKTTYYQALRVAAPELTDIAAGKKPRPPEVDQFAQAFSVAGEQEEKVADEATLALLTKLPFNSDLEKAKAAFAQAQSVEERFHHDFDGVDFTMR